MNATRAYALEKFAEVLKLPEDDTIPINLEKSVLNHCVRKVREPSWEDYWFVQTYRHKFLEIHKISNGANSFDEVSWTNG